MDEPHNPRSGPSVNGVYVPAISKKIAEWSNVRKTDFARVCGHALYSVEPRYNIDSVTAKITAPRKKPGLLRRASSRRIGAPINAAHKPIP
jgi:hypothetical protein